MEQEVFLTIYEMVPECPEGCPCEIPQAIAITPGNGPFGTPVKGFRLWTEYFPS